MQVVDRVCNSMGVLQRPSLQLDAHYSNPGPTAAVVTQDTDVDTDSDTTTATSTSSSIESNAIPSPKANNGPIFVNNNIYLLKEIPVWGIDCYTRRIIELCLQSSAAMSTTKKSITAFVEQTLLPTINSLPEDHAHNMKHVLSKIVQVSKQMSCVCKRHVF